MRTKVAGVVYDGYFYLRREYNLHVRGKRLAIQPDVWVLVAMDRLADTVIVPASVMGARVTAHIFSEQRRRVPSIWRQWIRRWDVIVGAARRAA